MYLHLMDLVGVFAFAVSGALTAGRQGMDLFGVLVVAAVTAIGGGTVRDVLLDRPVFWLTDTAYLYVIAAATVCTLVYARFRRLPDGALLVADAFGLSVFAVLGVRAGLGAGVSPLIAVIMGAITGVVGGVVRDVLCREIPLILRREIYATGGRRSNNLRRVSRVGGAGRHNPHGFHSGRAAPPPVRRAVGPEPAGGEAEIVLYCWDAA
jgi:uncharacterized membrane protein YeiH